MAIRPTIRCPFAPQAKRAEGAVRSRARAMQARFMLRLLWRPPS
jgi:hypothetical protein